MLDIYKIFKMRPPFPHILNNAEEIYSCYNDSKAVHAERRRTDGSIILFCWPPRSLAQAQFSSTGIYIRIIHCFLFMPVKQTLYCTGYGPQPSARSCAAGRRILYSVPQKRLLKEAKLCTATLSEIFKRHLGDSSISDEGPWETLRSRLGEFTRLCR